MNIIVILNILLLILIIYNIFVNLNILEGLDNINNIENTVNINETNIKNIQLYIKNLLKDTDNNKLSLNKIEKLSADNTKNIKKNIKSMSNIANDTTGTDVVKTSKNIPKIKGSGLSENEEERIKKELMSN